jgi:hypothetical protein
MRKKKIGNSFLKMLPTGRVSPVADLEVTGEIIENYFPIHDLDCDLKGREARLTKQAVLRLLHHARVMNKSEFLDDTRLPRNVPAALVYDSRRDSRARKIAKQRQILECEDATGADLLDAMDLVDKLFRGMDIQLRDGYLPDDYDLERDEKDFAMQRYMAAAMLPAVVKLLDSVWVPLVARMEDMQRRISRGEGVAG